MNGVRAAIGAALLAHAAVASAQDEGFRINPLFGMTEVQDTNLFFAAADRQSDLITRVSPGLESAYRGPVVRWLGRFVFDAERFDSHPELSSVDARHQATAALSFKTTERTTVSADADFVRTHMPGELNLLSGLNLARVSATRAMVHSGVEHRVDPVTTTTIDYTFSDSSIANGIGIRTHAGWLGMVRRLSQRDAIRAGYRVQQASFAPAPAGVTAETAHAIVLGWTHDITPRAGLSIEAGPRVTNGSLAPDLVLKGFYRTPAVDGALEYSRTQGTALGVAGIVDVQSVGASAAWRPWQSVEIGVTPTAYRNTFAPLHADVFRAVFRVTQAIGDRLAVEASFDGSVQHGNLIPALSQQIIPRRQSMIRMIVAAPKPKQPREVE